MLDLKHIAGSFSIAVVAQGVVLIGSVLTSLLVPKIMGVEDFGYWQLFIFYTQYVGFFHLGINDGIYLLVGGTPRSEVDRASINSQFLVSLLYQLAFALIVIIGALAFLNDQKRLFVLILTGVYLLITNASQFVGYLLQAMDETRLFSLYSAINGVLFLVPLCILLFFGIDQFPYYIVFYTAAHLVALCVCLWWVRDFIPAGLLPIKEAFSTSVSTIRVGIKLMIANVASMLILGVSRAFIDAQWGIETFGMVSFALSMVSFFLLFASQASMVLFPALRKASEKESSRFFSVSRDVLDFVLPACYILYFPAVLILQWWLPQYQPSFVYFAYLMPIVIYNGKMSIVGNTYLLVLRKESRLLLINLVTVAFSAAGAAIGTFVFESIDFIVFSSVIALMLRSVYVERMIAKLFGVDQTPLLIWTLLLSIAFIVFVYFFPSAIAAGLTCAAYVIFLAANRKLAMRLLGEAKELI